MNPFAILLLLFVTVPVAEIYLLIKVGGWIGAGWTVLLVVLTAVLGTALLRQQGLATLTRARQVLDAGGLPAIELVEGLVLAVGGALLLTPGFITDAVGFACLLPASRRLLVRAVLARVPVHGTPAGPGAGPGSPTSRGETLDGEYRRED